MKMASWSSVSEHLVNPIGMSDQLKWNNHNRGKIRNVTYDNIQKTILCSSIYLGYYLFVCPHCDKETIVPH